MNKIKLLTPIFALATTASIAVPLTSCTKASTVTWNSKRDGIYSEFKPVGEYTKPIAHGTYSYDEAWNKYFDNKCASNMLANDIVQRALHLFATTEDADLSMAVKVQSIDKKNHTLSYTKHIYGMVDYLTEPIDVTITVKKLHYDAIVGLDNDGEHNLFSSEWMLRNSKYWEDRSWSIEFEGDYKFVINADLWWYDVPLSLRHEKVINYLTIEPYYLSKVTMVEE